MNIKLVNLPEREAAISIYSMRLERVDTLSSRFTALYIVVLGHRCNFHSSLQFSLMKLNVKFANFDSSPNVN